MIYDPMVTPATEEWLAEDEAERLAAVERYHIREAVAIPSVPAHAGFHVAVENQIAMGEGSAVSAMARMAAEGLDRHDAVHAVASILARHTYHMLQRQQDFDQARYDADLDGLTAASWLSSGPGKPRRTKVKVCRRRG